MNSARENKTAPVGVGRLGAYGLLTIILAGAWLLWSGMYKPLLLGLGVFSCILTVYLAHRMRFFDANFFALRFSSRLFVFWLWLLKEIVVSSIEVARVVLARHVRLSTKVVEIDASDLDLVDQALLGNSITLTPGTLTMDVTDGRMLVHALTAEGADSIAAGEMQRRVAALRGGD